MDAVAHTVADQRRRGPIHHIAGRHLLASRLKEPVCHVLVVNTLGPAQDRKRRAHAHVDVDVGRAVKRVEDHRITGGRWVMRDHDRVVVLLRSQDPDALPEAQAVEQDLVGVDVELLLGLALDIDDTLAAQDVGQPRAAHLGLDHLGRQGDPREQPGELARGAWESLLLLQDMLLKRDDRLLRQGPPAIGPDRRVETLPDRGFGLVHGGGLRSRVPVPGCLDRFRARPRAAGRGLQVCNEPGPDVTDSVERRAGPVL